MDKAKGDRIKDGSWGGMGRGELVGAWWDGDNCMNNNKKIEVT